ncbi:TPA: hypothetical protein ACXDAM_002229 [Clostridium botulinum]|nr:hypothetical protein [Clostridium botulinum]
METIFNEIAREMKGHTNKAINKAASSLGFELGTMTSSGLKLDNFKYEIKDYLTLDYLKMKNEYNTETAGEHPHSHNLKIPKELKTLATGDRVLVALLGNEFVVVGRVMNA